MEPSTAKIGRYTVSYFNKKELKNLKEEIFQNEIYSVDLNREKGRKISILDVGSYIGLSVIYFKNRYPDSNIACFEPNPNVLPLLKENIFYNNLEDVKIHSVAIAKDSGQKKFYIDRSGRKAFSTASFRKNAWNGKQESTAIEVNTAPLSKYVNGRIDLVKMDIEGAEQEVLKELQEKACYKYIENIIIEYHPIKGQNINNIVKILKDGNFTLSYYQDGKTLENPCEDLILIVAKKRAK